MIVQCSTYNLIFKIIFQSKDNVWLSTVSECIRKVGPVQSRTILNDENHEAYKIMTGHKSGRILCNYLVT